MILYVSYLNTPKNPYGPPASHHPGNMEGGARPLPAARWKGACDATRRGPGGAGPGGKPSFEGCPDHAGKIMGKYMGKPMGKLWKYDEFMGGSNSHSCIQKWLVYNVYEGKSHLEMDDLEDVLW